MKTLNESLKEIQTSKMSVKAKKDACFKLGLTKYDIIALENTGFFKLPKRERTVTQRIRLTFGVEIECIVPARSVRERASANGLNIQYQSYNHTDNRHYYKFVTDASVVDNNGNNSYNGSDAIECVSPILDNNTTGFRSLENCCKTLNEAGAYVNKSCGLHVHVGIGDLNNTQIVNIYKNYQKLEDLIDSFMSESRRNSQWACSLRRFDFSDCNTQRDLEYTIGTRYCKVNPQSYSRHRTVEFRQHGGTTNYQKISMWVKFCTKLVAWSMNNTFSANVASIYDVPFLTSDEKKFFTDRINSLNN